MRKFFVLLAIFLFAGCTSGKGVLTSSGDTIIVETIGVGEDEDRALQKAFKKAVIDAAGSFVFGTERIMERRLVEDSIATYSPGFIKKHEVLEKRKEDDLVILKVRTEVNALPLREQLFRSDYRDVDDLNEMIKGLQHIEDVQERIEESVRLMNVFVGHDADFFERAYETNLIGYTVSIVSRNEVKGYYLVRLTLKKHLWDTYESLLSAIKTDKERVTGRGVYIAKVIISLPIFLVEGVTMPEDWHNSIVDWHDGWLKGSRPKHTFIKSRPTGMYSGCKNLKTEYPIPYEVRELPQFTITYAGAPDGPGLILDKNLLRFNPYFRGQKGVVRLYNTDVVDNGFFDDISACEGSMSRSEDSLFKGGFFTTPTLVSFDEEVIIKIPFVHSSTKEVRDNILNNSIPWKIRISN